nr:MAG TPA: hypothetical protein [Caudoviricetes sp.]
MYNWVGIGWYSHPIFLPNPHPISTQLVVGGVHVKRVFY